MAALTFDLSGILGPQPATRADDVRSMFDGYNRTMQYWEAAKADVSRVPGVPRMNMLEQRYNEIKKEQDDLATRLRAAKTQALADQSALRSAAIKSGRRGGSGMNAIEQGRKLLDTATKYEADVPGMELSTSFGKLPLNLAAVAQGAALTPAQVENIRSGKPMNVSTLNLGEETSKAFAQSKLGFVAGASDETTRKYKKISDAAGMVEAVVNLSGGGLNRDEAVASVAATYPGVDPADLEPGRLNELRGAVTRHVETLRPAQSPAQAALEARGIGLLSGGMGGGGRGGISASQLKALSPAKLPVEMQADLERYLTALSNDGIARAGEETGMGYIMTAADIEVGRAAYQEAKRLGAYTIEQAPLFNDLFLAKVRQGATSRETLGRQRNAVLSDYEMTGVERQQQVARQFLDMRNAAEGLRVALPYEMYGSAHERDVMGEMMDIVQKEGDLVFESTSLPTDRERRLGGRGSKARKPHQFAKQLYSMDKARPGGVSQAEVIPLINKRFRDPRQQEVALAYFLAMKEVELMGQQTGRKVEPMDVDETLAIAERVVTPPTPPTPPTPAAPPPTRTERRLPRAADVAPPRGEIGETLVDEFGNPLTDGMQGETLVDEFGNPLTDGMQGALATSSAVDGLTLLGESMKDMPAVEIDRQSTDYRDPYAPTVANLGSHTVPRTYRDARPPQVPPGLGLEGYDQVVVPFVGQGLGLEGYDQVVPIVGQGLGLEGYQNAVPGAAYENLSSDQILMLQGEMGSQNTGRLNESGRYLPRDAFLLDPQPYNRQVRNALLPGPPGSRNVGNRRKLV
jgi:hypothetical protein